MAMCVGMKISTEHLGMGIDMSDSCDAELGAVLVFVVRRALAEGLARVNVWIVEITADVHFLRLYSIEELVVDGWRVVVWGLILGWAAPLSPVALVPAVAMLVELEVGFGFGMVVEIVGVDGVVFLEWLDDGCEIPVNAVQMSAIGGSVLTHGTVNKGLSQQLCVLGSL